MSLVISPSSAVDITIHVLLALGWMLMLLWLRRWPLLFALSILPGTLAHELLHFLAGWIAGAKPVSLSVMPRRTSEGAWVLGSVAFTNLRWWNSAIVGLAPVALLPGSAHLFSYSLTLPIVSVQSMGLKLAAVQCLIASWPSPRDWSHAMVGLLMTGIIVLLGFLLMIKIVGLSF